MFENDRNISVTNKQSASYAHLCTLTVSSCVRKIAKNDY